MRYSLIVFSCFAFMTAAQAQIPATGHGCEAKAVSKDGKTLAGAARTAFIRKCEKDGAMAAARAACEARAVSKEGKALQGAARASFMKKCVTLEK